MRKTLCLLSSLAYFSYAMDYLELVGAKNAWEQGITGSGINIGIIDTGFQTSHPALQNRYLEVYPSSNVTHGTQVASTAVGAKIDENPHGIAYKAHFYGLPFSGYHPYGFFHTKNIKIINNSWGIDIYPVIKLAFDRQNNLIHDDTLDNPTRVLLFAQGSTYLSELMKLARDQKILSVLSSGNEGMSSASISSALPRYDESLRSWIVAGAIDSAYINKNNHGELVIQSKGLAYFSNGFKGVELFGLSAPGVNIRVANPDGGYGLADGTSFSSPIISGAGALLLEKFPFLNGAQVADVLLSTANKTYIAPKVVLKIGIVGKQPKYTVIYIDHPTQNITAEQARDDLVDAGYPLGQVNYALQNPLEDNVIQYLSREEVFGQGILDIDKALKGIAILDANRLNLGDIYGLSNPVLPRTTQALYTLDTQGHNATFSNDITQKKWDDSYHHTQAQNSPAQRMRNLNVGLLKTGEGKLTLQGSNTYAGITLIKQGSIALNKRENGTGGSLSSGVWIQSKGELQGNGVIYSNVFNEGILSPGNQDFDTLTIQGSYTQATSGTLKIHFGKQPSTHLTQNAQDSQASNSQANHAKLKANSYDIQGGILLYTPLKSRFYVQGEMIPITFDKTLQNQITRFEIIKITDNPSQSLDFTLKDSLLILVGKKPDAYMLPDIQSNLGEVLQNISSQTPLNPQYQDYFAKLDSTSKWNYTDALKSLDGDLYLKNTKEILNTQTSFQIADLFLLLEPEKNKKWLFTPSVSYQQDSQYSSIIGSFAIQGKNKVSDKTATSGFAQFSYLQTKDKSYSSEALSYFGSTGLSLSYDLKAIEIFGGISLGYAYNQAKRELGLDLSQIQGSYHNLLALVHLGTGKAYQISNSLFLTPLVWLENLYTYQSSWQEKQNLFSKVYSSSNYNLLSASAGVKFGYEDRKFGVGIFGLYTRHIIGNQLDNQAYFKDFSDLPLTQRYTIDPNAFKAGVSLSFTFQKFALGAKVRGDFAKDFWGVGGDLNLGTQF